MIDRPQGVMCLDGLGLDEMSRCGVIYQIGESCLLYRWW